MNENLPVVSRATNLTNMQLNSGTVNLPSMSFSGDTTTGLWLPSVGNIALSIGGVNLLTANSSKLVLDFPGISLLEQAQADVPAPSSSTRHMLYIDSTSKHLSYKNSNNSIVDLSYSDAQVGTYLSQLTGLTAPSGSDFTITTSDTGRLAVNAGSSYPINNNHVATKEYVDNYAAGLKVHQEVKTKTTANLTATYSNGTSGVGATLTSTTNVAIGTINGYALSVSDRILVANQSTTYQNGIYTVTQLGSGSEPWILTRASDLDGSPTYEVTHGVYTFVAAGDYLGKGFVLSTPSNSITGPNNTILIGTDPLIWAQFAGSGTGSLTASRLLGTDALSVISSVNLSSYILGTTKQVTVTDNGSGDVTLSLPQDIASVSSPSFAGLTLSNTTADTLVYSNGSKLLSSVTIGSGLSLTAGTLAATLSLPQDIATTASPTFAGLTINGTTADTLIYSNGSKLLSSVTIGSGLSLTAGTLAATSSVPQDISTSASPTFAGLNFGSITSAITASNTTRTTITTTSGIRVNTPVTVTAANTLTNFYGVYIANTGTVNLNTTGAITNGYGLYVDNPTYGTNKYAACFNGDVIVGRIFQCAKVNANTNVSIGPYAMENASSNTYTTAVGVDAYRYKTGGQSNTAIGASALIGASNNTGSVSQCTAIGTSALGNLQGNANDNTAVGNQAGQGQSSGSGNVFLGAGSGVFSMLGSYKTLLGAQTSAGGFVSNAVVINASANTLTAANNNTIFINASTNAGSTSATNQLLILTGARGGCFIDSIKAVNDQANFLEYNAATNEVTYGTTIASSAKYKENIQPAAPEFLEVFNAVDVKKFDYNETAAEPYKGMKDVHGMIAEEVEAVFPFACKYVTNAEGTKELFTIKYELMVIPLWHMVKQLKKEIADLRNHLHL